MSKTVRVLHVLGRTARGGAESRIMDLYRAIDRDRIQFDFLVHADAGPTGKSDPTSEELMAVRKEDDFDAEIRSLGGNIYAVPRLRVSVKNADFAAYRRACRAFFDEHSGIWRVVQGHMTSTAAVYLAAARWSGIPVTVAHARSAGTDPGIKGILTKVLRLPLSSEDRKVRMSDGIMADAVDYRFACSREAAYAVFHTAPTVILPNAIDVSAFRYNVAKRIALRRKLGLQDSRVIGHVGSFRYAKNHEFLIRVFAGLLKRSEGEDYRLLLLGNGELFEQMKGLAESLGVADRVVFCGNRPNINDYYQAMDVFAFPSRYEGLPGSVLEAQAASLPCLISDAVTHDVDVTNLVRRAPVDRDPAGVENRWITELLDMFAARRPGAREDIAGRVAEKLAATGFDVAGQVKMLTEFYELGTGLPAAVSIKRDMLTGEGR